MGVLPPALRASPILTSCSLVEGNNIVMNFLKNLWHFWTFFLFKSNKSISITSKSPRPQLEIDKSVYVFVFLVNTIFYKSHEIFKQFILVLYNWLLMNSLCEFTHQSLPFKYGELVLSASTLQFEVLLKEGQLSGIVLHRKYTHLSHWTSWGNFMHIQSHNDSEVVMVHSTNLQ